MILVSFVCVAAIGMTAATLDSANPAGASGGDPIMDPPTPREAIGPGNTTGGGSGGATNSSVGSSYQSLTTCVEFLSSTLGTMLVIGGVLAISLLIYVRFNGALALFTGWTVFPPIMLVYFLFTDCGGGGDVFTSAGAVGLSASGKSLVGVSDVPSWMLIVPIGLVVVGAAALVYRSAGRDEAVIVEDESAEDDVELDGFAEAAGRAADRIEEHNEGVDNAVYQAWVEMTDLLDVESPETYSAGEFATAAVELGMAEDDVEELTRLFNEVRYGDRDVETREEQAVSVLRNIEAAYSEAVASNVTDDTEMNDTSQSTDDGSTDSNREGER